jgi:proline dehydrogenase
MSKRFVPGETVESFVEAAKSANALGLKVTGNFLGEAEHDLPGAREAAEVYLQILDAIVEHELDANISVKPTQAGLEVGIDAFCEIMTPILRKAKEHDIFVRMDMESSDWTQITLDAFERLWNDGWTNLGTVLQSYLRRTNGDVQRMNELGVRVRLCKGAYAEPADVAFQQKSEVDSSYVELTKALMREPKYPALATHDDAMADEALSFADAEGIGAERFEFQMLHGVRRDLQRELLDEGHNVRVYIPFGGSWYPYLMRRLAERPANVLFMVGSILREATGRGKKKKT